MSSRFWQGQDVEDAPRAAAWLNDLEAQAYGGSIPPVGNNTAVTYSGLWPGADTFPRAADTTIETIFASGHGFASSGSSSGTTVADDTSTFLLGSQSLKITTSGAGSSAHVSARKTGAAALDTTSKYLAVTLMADNPAALQNLEIDVSSDAFVNWSKAQLVSSTANATSPYFVPNEWVTILLPMSTGTYGLWQTGGGSGATMSALTGFQIRVSDDGTAAVNVWVNKISVVAVPANGVVSFTFDDGYVSQITKGKTYMDQYGYRGTFAPIIDLLGTSSYMTLAQAQSLYAAGWEPAVHAYQAAVHDNYAAQTDAQVEADVQQAKAYMRANGLGSCDSFLIPQGKITTANRHQLWRRYFNAARSSYQQTRETYPPARRIGMRTVSVDSSSDAATINGKIDAAITSGCWVILEIHQITDTAAGSGVYVLTSMFQSIVDHINSSAYKVKTISDVVKTGVA